MKTEDILIFFSALGLLALLLWKKSELINLPGIVMEKLTRKQFIDKFAPIAVLASKNTGLFPSVFMAQAILESGNGNSSLSKEANNYFGIKADSKWLNSGGAFVTKPTYEYVNGEKVKIDAKFRAYETPLDSFYDRVNFLLTNSRYKNNGVFIAATPEAQAAALQRAGYATDPNYSNLLVTLINQNNLKQFDV